jgi:DMSO/TMAO reductase YedYZ molybdopterin-dependent catalytic subunit
MWRSRFQDAAGLDRGRRDLLRGAFALPLACAVQNEAGACAAGSDDRPSHGQSLRSGQIIRQRHPDNLEFPFSSLDGFLTSNEQFYVRNHFDVPELPVKTWRLKVEGEVAHPLSIGYDELRRMPSRTMPVLLECSGNGRVFLKPPQVGIRWELGAVSTALWTGVPLVDVLDKAGVKPTAVEVILEGADHGEFTEPNPKTPGAISYARSLPMAKARAPEVLLAHQMNGHDLPPRHGQPVRAVVAGWYGMASVKWLRRIIITDRPFQGYFQSFMYATWERHHGLPSLTPVSQIQVKAQIARPAPYEVVQRGSSYRMHGAAWAGESNVARVEVSADGGQTWAQSRLLGDPVRFAWRLWEYDWTTPERPGPRVIMARATDERSRSQPNERDTDRRDAVINHILPIEIELR